MRLLSKILIVTGIIVLAFGFYVLRVAWLEPTGGFRTSHTLVFSSEFSIESFDNKIVVVDLKNYSNYEYELITYVDEYVNVSCSVTNPDGYEVEIFNFHKGFDIFPDDQEFQRYHIRGQFNSTVTGNYNIIMNEISGESFSVEFELAELTHLWMDRYKHFFNPAPLIAFPIILVAIILLIIGIIYTNPKVLKTED